MGLKDMRQFKMNNFGTMNGLNYNSLSNES